MQNLYWFITIAKRSDNEEVFELFQELEVPRVYSCLANGTAKSEMLHILGLENEEKCVIFSVIREDKAEEILHVLQDKFASVRGGKGIAFTSPLSSVIGVTAYGFLSNNKTVVKENKDE